MEGSAPSCSLRIAPERSPSTIDYAYRQRYTGVFLALISYSDHSSNELRPCNSAVHVRFLSHQPLPHHSPPQCCLTVAETETESRQLKSKVVHVTNRNIRNYCFRMSLHSA